MKSNKKEMNLHPIFGYKRDSLPKYNFPTKLQVLNYVRYKIDSSPKKHQIQSEKVEKYQEIATEVIKIWERAYVTCLNVKSVAEKITNEIVSEKLNVQKRLNRYLNSQEKKKELLLNLNKVFHIAKCKCFEGKKKEEYIYSNCVCPGGDKIINFQCYTEQMFDSQARILLSEEEKNKYELMVSGLKIFGKHLLFF